MVITAEIALVKPASLNSGIFETHRTTYDNATVAPDVNTA